MPSAGGQGLTGRRTRLPATRPDTEGLSLWNLLCKNIGKDLSQVSMPVTINEPLNMLQVCLFSRCDVLLAIIGKEDSSF